MQHFCTLPGEDRLHTIYRYTDQIYKIVQWYRPMLHTGPGPVEEHKHYDKKLESSLSRSRRVILEKALCNPWEWFVTLTISGSKFDRTDLATWRDTFTQWLRDERKKGKNIKYLIVPEQHQDGTWHAHGLLSGVSESDLVYFSQMDKAGYRTPNGRRLPRHLIESEYMNWTPYFNKFGFCSLARIQNHTAASFYMTKYMTKDNDRRVSEVGLKSYYCSQGLNVAEKQVDYFGRDPELERLLVNEYEWCKTGMSHLRDRLDWTFAFRYDFSVLEPLDAQPDPGQDEAVAYYDFEQISLEDKWIHKKLHPWSPQ